MSGAKNDNSPSLLNGLPVAVDIASGQASDYAGALPPLGAGWPEPKVLLADRSYDAVAIRTAIEVRGVADHTDAAQPGNSDLDRQLRLCPV